jgi:hypothetical protein
MRRLSLNQKLTLKELRRGRRWFAKPNSVVRDWNNYYEFDKNGKVCRKCIIGSISSTPANNLIQAVGMPLTAEVLWGAVLKLHGDAATFTDKYTRREVLAIFDSAIWIAKQQREPTV